MGGEILELHSERVYKKGRLDGKREGGIKMLISLVKNGTISIAQAAAQLGEPEETFRARMAKR